MNWTKEQKRVIEERGCNLLVSAAAGSGKTAVLVERIIQMIFDKDNPIDIDRLLVVTFTKAAAAQMKEKIGKALEKKIEDEPSNKNYVRQLNLLNDANILTIDSFCYKLVKEYFHVIAVDPKVRVAEETELEMIKQEILDEVMEDHYRDDKAFADFSNAFSSDKNDDRIEEYILKLYELSESYPFPEKWLNNAKDNLHIENDDDLSNMDFMKAYIRELHVNAEEIKETVLRYLEAARDLNGPKHYAETLVSDIERIDDIISANSYAAFNNIYMGKFSTLKRAKKSDVYDPETAEMIKNGRDRYKKQINALLDVFSMPVDKVIEQFNASEDMLAAFVDITMDFSKRFLERKSELSLVGFSDVEHYALQILCEGTDDDGNPVQSAVGKELSERFYEILIDEYQDSNYLQENILRCVSKVPYGKNNIFMVGDVKQSIYAFRMARPELFTEKYNSYEEITDEPEKEGAIKDYRDADEGIKGEKEEAAKSSDQKKIILQNNFRSRKNILDYTNYMFYQIMRESLGGIDYTEKEALSPGKKYPAYDKDEVELLLGESKDYSDRSMSGDTALAADDTEHLDDEYIDVSGMELEAGMVADRIEKLMGDNENAPYMITDDVTEKLRPVEYRDIVILFRAPKAYQPIFSEILTKRNIPVRLQNENGYFDTVEIISLMTLLKVIDNPYNDVECAALLRGYFGGLDNNELAVLTLMKRHADEVKNNIKENTKDNTNKDVIEDEMKQIYTKYIYSFVSSVIRDEKIFSKLFYVAAGDNTSEDISQKYSCESLYKKCTDLIDRVKYFQKERKVCSISVLIEKILYETGYYYYVMAMPQGRERSRNLTLLLDETKKFEHGKTKTLFDFLRFVKRISERKITLGGDALSESSDNMIRIMSIHKSKGLEFPVVFVSGLGKRFNMNDTRLPLMLHSDYYISAKYVDPHKRCVNDTFMRKAVASLMKSEVIAEELRVFYVALTRAKEKLILTAVTPDIIKLVKRLEPATQCERTKLSHSILSSMDSYLEMLAAAWMRSHEFNTAMKRIEPRYDSHGNQICAGYDVVKYLDTGDVRTKICVYEYNELVHSQIDTGISQGMIRKERLEGFLNSKASGIAQLNKNLEWDYIDEDIKEQKAKMSVTEIKRLHQLNDDTQEAGEEEKDTFDKRYKEIIPRFISEDVSVDAAFKGTLYHKVMELVDNRKLIDELHVEQELERLFSTGIIPQEGREFITIEKIAAFSKSRLGIRMQHAAVENKLFKERKFVVGFPVKEGAPEVVVQGIIDAYFEEDGKLILMDYKTDNIKSGQEDILVKRYATQLDYYKRTLEKITGTEVSEVYLYSFALDKEIEM